MRILAVSGSLRSGSGNTALLAAAARLAEPPMRIALYADLGRLPHFNPDLDAATLDVVRALEDAVTGADGLLLSTPEYARGLPGSFKNLLDWLVGGAGFVRKPVAILNASPRSTVAQEQLRLTVATMSGRIVEEACVTVPLPGRGLDADAILADARLAEQIRAALSAFGAGIETLWQADRAEGRA